MRQPVRHIPESDGGSWGCSRNQLLSLAVAVLLIAAAVAGSGFVLMKLWGWFFAPTFGLPALTPAQAVGIAFTVNMVSPGNSAEGKELGFYPACGRVLGRLVGGLGFGYLIHILA